MPHAAEQQRPGPGSIPAAGCAGDASRADEPAGARSAQLLELRQLARRQQRNAQWAHGLAAVPFLAAGMVVLTSLLGSAASWSSPDLSTFEIALPFLLPVGGPALLAIGFGGYVLAQTWRIAARARQLTEHGLAAGDLFHALTDDEWLQLVLRRLPDISFGQSSPRLEFKSFAERARFFAFHLPSLRRLLRQAEAPLPGLVLDELVRRGSFVFGSGVYPAALALLPWTLQPHALLQPGPLLLLALLPALAALPFTSRAIRANSTLVALCDHLREG